MTLRLTLGVDPGQTGCIAALADGQPAGFIDMPTLPRRAGGQQVDGAALARELRLLLFKHPGAYTLAVIEQVGAMPGQGGASMFRFGQSDGVVRGVLGALGIGIVEVPPQTWKRVLRLTGAPKDAARTAMVQRFPQVGDQMRRKKDVGRADALAVAVWGEMTGQVGEVA